MPYIPSLPTVINYEYKCVSIRNATTIDIHLSDVETLTNKLNNRWEIINKLCSDNITIVVLERVKYESD